MADETKRDTTPDVAGLLENVMLMGIGALEAAREKGSEISDDLLERGRTSKSDAKEVVGKFSEAAEKQQEVMRTTVARETDRAMKTAGVATKEDIEELRAEIGEIKRLIAGLATVQGSGTATPTE